LYFSEDLFSTIFAFLCLGYAGWIISIRPIWSIVYLIKSISGSTQAKKDKTHFAIFPDDYDRHS
jgi:hypothetical protein